MKNISVNLFITYKCGDILLLSGEIGKNKMVNGIRIKEDSFGQDGVGNSIRRFTMINENYVTVQVINYGATVTSIKVPDKRGCIDDVVLGFDDMSGKLVVLQSCKTYIYILKTKRDNCIC